MTFEILKSNTMDDSFKNNIKFKKVFKFFGYFYEHKTITVGFVYSDRELLPYIARNGVDPAVVGGTNLRNWADLFCTRIKKT